MILQLKTHVEAELSTVKAGFNSTLLERLSPPFPKAKIEKYDGNHPGSEVHIRLKMIFFSLKWVSVISHEEESPEHYLFIDEGLELPFFLKSWKHRHLLRKNNGGTLISDHITFTSGNIIGDVLLFPLLWMQFAYRIPIYKKTFRNK
ncbi:MAG: hypothetical protein ACFCUU_10630 [Cyclobacteriaceae bacterium]